MARRKKKSASGKKDGRTTKSRTVLQSKTKKLSDGTTIPMLPLEDEHELLSHEETTYELIEGSKQKSKLSDWLTEIPSTTQVEKRDEEPHRKDKGKSTIQSNETVTQTTKTAAMDGNNEKAQSTLKISQDDIADELNYWNLAVVCYVIDSNPHFRVFDGFARRIWGKDNVDKTIPIKKGIFVVRLLNKETQERALTMTNLMLDKRPVFVKQWEKDEDVESIDIVKLPIWIQLPHLPVRYWGQGCLSKIVELVGKPIKPDSATQQRERLTFARYLIEIPINAELPNNISFEDEKGNIRIQPIKYEWRPSYCQKCKCVGHSTQKCSKTHQQEGKERQGPTNTQEMVWKPKHTTQPPVASQEGHMIQEAVTNPHPNQLQGPQSSDWQTVRLKNAAHRQVSSHQQVYITSTLQDEMNVDQVYVGEGWDKQRTGVAMHKVCSKLKALKQDLKTMNKLHCPEVEQNWRHAEQILADCQQNLHSNPTDLDLRRKEAEAREHARSAKRIYTKFLKQKAKLSWLKDGDSNTALFHRAIKIRKYLNSIYQVKNKQEEEFDTPNGVAKAFIEFYKNLLGEKNDVHPLPSDIIKQGPQVTVAQATLLTTPFTKEDVKEMIFSIPNDKAPGPDGYSSKFFKKAWPIIGEEITEAILQFFDNGKLLKQLNATTLTLIPKVTHPRYVTDYRPIACCNILYKCITKMISSRLKLILPDIINPVQAGFVQGRFIVDNISIAQDILHKYRRKNSPPSCIIKIDISKAYDSISWEFLKSMMENLNFPDKFTDWIMSCVSTSTFSLAINGALHGFFQGQKGLRQGTQCPPYSLSFAWNASQDYCPRLPKVRSFTSIPDASSCN
ncbi:hypothetical protein RDABS01_000903 [Bienertia sinuspersici]